MTDVYCRLDCEHRMGSQCIHKQIIIPKIGKCLEFKRAKYLSKTKQRKVSDEKESRKHSYW